MSELNLNLNDGKEKIYINKEKYGEDRVIWINLSDINILTRVDDAYKNINKFMEKIKETEPKDVDKTIKVLKDADKYIREQVNYIFDYDVSDAVFGKTFATADVGGKPYIQAFFEAIAPVIENKVKKQTAKISKYTDKYIK